MGIWPIISSASRLSNQYQARVNISAAARHLIRSAVIARSTLGFKKLLPYDNLCSLLGRRVNKIGDFIVHSVQCTAVTPCTLTVWCEAISLAKACIHAYMWNSGPKVRKECPKVYITGKYAQQFVLLIYAGTESGSNFVANSANCEDYASHGTPSHSSDKAS